MLRMVLGLVMAMHACAAGAEVTAPTGSGPVAGLSQRHVGGVVTLAHLAQTQFKDRPVKLVMPDAEGVPRVEDLHDLIEHAPSGHTE